MFFYYKRSIVKFILNNNFFVKYNVESINIALNDVKSRRYKGFHIIWYNQP